MERLRQLLADLQLLQYLPLLERHGVQDGDLAGLSDGELAAFGIDDPTHRKAILRAALPVQGVASSEWLVSADSLSGEETPAEPPAPAEDEVDNEWSVSDEAAPTHGPTPPVDSLPDAVASEWASSSDSFRKVPVPSSRPSSRPSSQVEAPGESRASNRIARTPLQVVGEEGRALSRAEIRAELEVGEEAEEGEEEVSFGLFVSSAFAGTARGFLGCFVVIALWTVSLFLISQVAPESSQQADCAISCRAYAEGHPGHLWVAGFAKGPGQDARQRCAVRNRLGHAVDAGSICDLAADRACTRACRAAADEADPSDLAAQEVAEMLGDQGREFAWNLNGVAPWSYLVFLVAALAALISLRLSGLTSEGWEFPAVLWFLLPLLTVLAGTIGGLTWTSSAWEWMDDAVPAERTQVALQGIHFALFTRFLGLSGGGICLALVAALGALGTGSSLGDRAVSTKTEGLVAAFVGVGGGLLAVAWALVHIAFVATEYLWTSWSLLAVGLATCFGAVAIGWLGTAMGSGPEARLASRSRALVAVAAIGGVVVLATAALEVHKLHGLMALLNAETLGGCLTEATASRMGSQISLQLGFFCVMALVVAGLITVAPHGRSLLQARTLRGAGLALCFILFVLGLEVSQARLTDAFLGELGAESLTCAATFENRP